MLQFLFLQSEKKNYRYIAENKSHIQAMIFTPQIRKF